MAGDEADHHHPQQQQPQHVNVKKKDAAIRRKVEQELSRKAASKRNSLSETSAIRSGLRVKKGDTTVSSLRPNPAITVLESARIIQVAQLMAAKRSDAVLIVNEEGHLSGILTDKDIAYRVVAEGLDVRQTTVAHVMTCNPVSVQSITARNEALNIMVARRFRHLPVISSSSNNINRIDTTPSSRLASSSPSPTPSYHTDTVGTGNTSTNVVGLLDITKCVFERLDELERKVNEDGNIVKAMDALERRGAVASDHAGAIKALHAGCPDLLSVLTGGISSTTADAKLALSGEDPAAVVFDEEVPQVTVRASVREAARAMKEFHHTAVLVVANGSTDKDDRLGGIFTTKDIVLRVIAAGLDPITTSVIRVMTPHPDSVSTDTTILEALKKLHAGHYLHLPVVDDRVPVGLVDVMTLTMAMLDYLMAKDFASGSNIAAISAPDGVSVGGGGDSGPLWNKFWNSTFTGNDFESETHSAHSDGGGGAGGTESRSSSSTGFYQQQPPQSGMGGMAGASSLDDTLAPLSSPYQSSQSHFSYPQRGPRMSSNNSSTANRNAGGFNLGSSPSLLRRESAPTYSMQPHTSSYHVPPPSTINSSSSSSLIRNGSTHFSFKVRDPRSNTVFRVAAQPSDNLAGLITSVKSKLGLGNEVESLSYEDDEGDLVCMSSDADLRDAVDFAKGLGWNRLVIVVKIHGRELVRSVSRGRRLTSDATSDSIPQVANHIVPDVVPDGRSCVNTEEAMVLKVAISAGIVVLASFIISKYIK